MLGADHWCVKVDERVYGPYTSLQLRKYAHEGRLAAWSLIAPAGSRSWREARDEKAFSRFFGEQIKPPGANSHFGKRHSDAPSGSTTNAANSSAESALANFVVVFDVVSASASKVEAAILSLGPAFRLADNVWTVSCELTATGVRNAIAPYLRPQESIFVVDATRGRTAWQNYPPEAQSKISAAWSAIK